MSARGRRHSIATASWRYKADRQSNHSPLILEGVGEVRRGPISDVRMSRRLLVWTEGPRHSWGYDRTAGRVVDLDVQGTATYRPIPVETPGGVWILNNTDSGVILRPLAVPLEGYRFDNNGQTYLSGWLLCGRCDPGCFHQ